MSEIHPSDEQLLLYADGEQADAVEEHLAGCAECRSAVEAARRGRDVLAAAPLLELPAARREAVLSALPAHERRRRPGRRFLGVAVPLVALGSVVAVVGLSGGGDPERTAEQMAAEDAAREAPAALEAAPAEDTAPIRSVEGPPEEVAQLLRDRGLEARVVGERVEVREAERPAVERALAGRPDGDVPVLAREP